MPSKKIFFDLGLDANNSLTFWGLASGRTTEKQRAIGTIINFHSGHFSRALTEMQKAMLE